MRPLLSASCLAFPWVSPASGNGHLFEAQACWWGWGWVVWPGQSQRSNVWTLSNIPRFLPPNRLRDITDVLRRWSEGPGADPSPARRLLFSPASLSTGGLKGFQHGVQSAHAVCPRLWPGWSQHMCPWASVSLSQGDAQW